MNVEIGAEAAQFPEKEYINGIAVAALVIVGILSSRIQYYSLCKDRMTKSNTFS
jgi:hypothetical protein